MSDKYETIPSGNTDPNYRYKMIKMKLKQESRLNGVKTNIFNVEDVAVDLRVPAQAIMKWMSQELGTQLEGHSTIKGKFNYDVMLKQLDKFIHKYVICPGCKYPELIMSLDGSKGLKSICKSCGKAGTHDHMHKAGKIIVQTLQQGQTQKQDISATEVIGKGPTGTEDPDEIIGGKFDGEFDDESDLDGDLTIQSRRIDKLIVSLKQLMVDEPDITNEELNTFLQDQKASMQLSDECLHYVALCGIFSPKRNIVKYWDLNEELFLRLVKNDGKLGIDHFMQSVVLYFIRMYNKQLSRFSATFLKKLLDNNTISEQFIQEWFDKTYRLDKDSMLYDKKAEKKFRDLVTDFVEWMKTAETEEVDSATLEAAQKTTGTAEDDDDDDEKTKDTKETDQQRKQRLAIEKQARAQQELLEKMKQQHTEQAVEQEIVSDGEKRIDVTKINKDEVVDVDDI